VAYSDLEDDECSIARSLALLGDKWTLVVLRQSFRGIRRFDEIQSSLGIPRALLAERLARLVDAGVLERRPYADERRTRHEYRLTEKGMDLYPTLMALRTWGDKYLAPEGPFVVYQHRGCGGAAQVRHTCAECGQELSARDVIPEAGPGMTRSSGQLAHT
jgi:DNA-binding HxlR family transcriptional regulator